MTTAIDPAERMVREWSAAATVARLFHHLDARDYDAVAALFADDGVWVRLGSDLIGPAAVGEAMAARPAALATRHLVTNMVAEAGEDGVDARYYVTVFDDPAVGDGPAVLTSPGAIFACHDRLVATPAGWRFRSRRPSLVFKRP